MSPDHVAPQLPADDPDARLTRGLRAVGRAARAPVALVLFGAGGSHRLLAWPAGWVSDAECVQGVADAAWSAAGLVEREGVAAVPLLDGPRGSGVQTLGAVVVAPRRARGGRTATPVPVRAWRPTADALAEVLTAHERTHAAHDQVARYERWFATQDRHIRVLDRERQKFAALVNQSGTYSYVTNADGIITWVNKTLADAPPLDGSTWLGQACGRACAQLVGDPQFACGDCPARGALQSSTVVRRELRADGTAGRTLYVTALPVKGPDGSADETLMLVQDLTDLEVLRESAARKGAMLESALDAVVTLDARGRITEFNPAAERIFGHRRDDVLGRGAELLVPDDKLAAYRDGFHRCITTGESSVFGRRVDMTGRRADGTTMPLELSVALVRSMDEPMITAFLRDLSEERQLEEQLRHAQKMEAVGRLAGGVAHDFNNLLTVIMGHSELLGVQLPADHPCRSHALEIQKAGRRGGWLTRQLLAFSRRDVAAPTVFDLGETAGEIDTMLRRLIGEDVELVTAFAHTPHIRADRGQIEQVIMNLAINARDAMPRGGRLTLSLRDASEDEARARTSLPPGAYVVFTVADTGCGMDADTLHHIFEPFFTTKDQSKGTGLGLSIVYAIVREAGGDIVIDSEPGRGTAVHVYLPVVSVAADATDTETDDDAIGARGHETILLVEDELGVRTLCEEILTTAGYRVLAAASGPQALVLAAAHTGPLDLLLSDVIMPEMGGGETARRLLDERPGVRVIFMSGYTDDAVVRHGVSVQGMPFLQKPFSVDALLRKVREVLDAPRSSPSITIHGDSGDSRRAAA